jgi:hypothetical protein
MTRNAALNHVVRTLHLDPEAGWTASELHTEIDAILAEIRDEQTRASLAAFGAAQAERCTAYGATGDGLLHDSDCPAHPGAALN